MNARRGSGIELPSDRLPGTVPAERIASRDVPRHAAALSARLLDMADLTSAVADALDELGVGAVVAGHRLPRIAGRSALCGPAVTARYALLDGDVTANRIAGRGRILGDRDLYGLARPGDVAVMDGSVARDIAILGGLSVRWAALSGVAGIVLDGAARDTATLRSVGLPVWSTGRNPACARYRFEAVELNGPVTLFGHVVHPGDQIVADDDGVCIVPHAHFPAVVEHCLAAHQAEQELTALIGNAGDVTDVVAALRHRTSPV